MGHWFCDDEGEGQRPLPYLCINSTCHVGKAEVSGGEVRGTAILRNKARQSHLLPVDNVLLLVLWLLQRLKRRHNGGEVSEPWQGWRRVLPDEAVRYAVACSFRTCLFQATKPFRGSLHWARIDLSYRITKMETSRTGKY